MGESIPEVRFETRSLDGLDDFFSSDRKAHPPVDECETVDATICLTVSEARRVLGLPKSTLYRQIKEGRFQTLQGEDGRLRILLSQKQDQSSQQRDDEFHTSAVPPPRQSVSNSVEFALIREMQTKIEALTYRQGYLQAELAAARAESEATRNELKLLTDSLHKHRSWWQRLLAWTRGGD